MEWGMDKTFPPDIRREELRQALKPHILGWLLIDSASDKPKTTALYGDGEAATFRHEKNEMGLHEGEHLIPVVSLGAAVRFAEELYGPQIA